MGSPLTRNEILAGARFGAYQIVGVIGRGATAAVFEARHVSLGKPVAIKLLHEHLAGDADIAARFVREGRVMAQLRHPHAVGILDVGEERGVPYLVMDLLEGVSLHGHLAGQRVLALDEALGIVFPIAAALAYAHALGIIHRDVKPANIFLSRDARAIIVPKLVDFGLSKITDGRAGPSPESSNVLMGTLTYMAPEQTRGASFTTASSDQYALAAVLYECIVGQPPFGADDFYELMEAVRASVVKPPSLTNARLPVALDDVVLRALHREPSKRFSGVREFASALMPFASPAVADSWRRDFSEKPSVHLVAEAPAPSSSVAQRPGKASPPADLDWLTPFPKPREKIGDAKHFRSTWLTASQATIRARGMGERYEQALAPEHRDEVLSVVAGLWLPMPIARAHYTACESLGFTESDLVEIGRLAMRRANATALSFVTRLAQGAGVTPWTALGQTHRFWAQTCDDGFLAIARLGPKEAHLEIIGYPLAGIRYNRVTMRGIVLGCVELFCRKAYVREIPTLCSERTLGMRLSWV